MATRAMTAPELALVRTEGQWSRFYLAIRKPTTVYTARVNGTPASNDMVGQITYDGGSGTLADVKAGMTMLVGTSAGGRELGTVRIRKTPGASTFYIGKESEIAWQDNAYLTVLDEFGLWARHIHVDGATMYMDYDIAYGDQHSVFDPIPLLGSDAVLWLEGATVSITWPSAAGSYVPDGSGISGYSWAAPGASATSGLTTATPTFTYNAPGQYQVYCTVTAANGKSFTGTRTIYVYSQAAMPETRFKITESPKGSYDEGGWSFEAELLAGADLSEIRDRTRVILFAKDWYGSTKGSVGPVAGMENIVAAGWIEGETIEKDAISGNVKFRVSGPQEWLKRMTGYPVGLQRRTAGADGWGTLQRLTVRNCLWHLLHWRSTATAILDVLLTSDTRQMENTDNLSGTLWGQMGDAAKRIMAQPVTDRYGSLYCEVDQQLVTAAGRTGCPVTMAITKRDWQETLQISRRIVSDTGRVELSGVKLADAAQAQTLYSLAPGHVARRYGEVIGIDNLLLADQASANSLAGLILGYNNRPYDFEFSMPQNNRMIDIAPRAFLSMAIAAEDTPRGITFNGRLVMRDVEYEIKQEEGSQFLHVNVGAEGESVEDLSINGDIPPGDPPLDIPPDPPLPPLPPVPPGPLPEPGATKIVVMNIKDQGIFYTKDFDSPCPHWFAMNAGLDTTRKLGILQFEVDYGGGLWLLTHANFGSKANPAWGSFSPIEVKQEIWYAAGVGQPWTLVFDNSMMMPDDYAFARGPTIRGMGIARGASDQIVVIGNAIYTIGSDPIAQVLKGSHAGLTKVSPPTGAGIHKLSGSLERGFMLPTAGGGWMLANQDDHDLNAVSTIPGGTLYPVTNIISAANGKPIITTSRHASPGAIWHTAPIQITQNSGASWSSPAGSPTPYGYNNVVYWFQSSCCDPTGLLMLVGDAAGVLLKKSSDGGVTWGNCAAIAGTTTAVWHMGHAEASGDRAAYDAWVIGFAHQVRYSEDFFDTYVDKTGDLWTWVGSLADILSIRSGA